MVHVEVNKNRLWQFLNQDQLNSSFHNLYPWNLTGRAIMINNSDDASDECDEESEMKCVYPGSALPKKEEKQGEEQGQRGVSLRVNPCLAALVYLPSVPRYTKLLEGLGG